jgi:hypothetical protein
MLRNHLLAMLGNITRGSGDDIQYRSLRQKSAATSRFRWLYRERKPLSPEPGSWLSSVPRTSQRDARLERCALSMLALGRESINGITGDMHQPAGITSCRDRHGYRTQVRARVAKHSKLNALSLRQAVDHVGRVRARTIELAQHVGRHGPSASFTSFRLDIVLTSYLDERFSLELGIFGARHTAIWQGSRGIGIQRHVYICVSEETDAARLERNWSSPRRPLRIVARPPSQAGFSQVLVGETRDVLHSLPSRDQAAIEYKKLEDHRRPHSSASSIY